jgi:hypothetical protein
MNLSDIKAAVSAKTEIEIMIPDVGTIRGVPSISWKKRMVTLTQANGNKARVEFDDIPGF